MMMNSSENKSMLAKLLASENIRIQHVKQQTASFDTKERILTLPIWKDMDSDLYDMLIGHEVGHALYTPPEEWRAAIMAKIGSGYKSYLNVIEDARIERKMKDKYPGLRRNFYNAYQALSAKDFFGLAKNPIQSRPLIDRINLYFKVGPFMNIKFTDREQLIIERIEEMETFQDAVDIATELYESAKDQKQEDMQEMMESLQMSSEQGEESDPSEPQEMPETSESDQTVDTSETEDGESDEKSELEEASKSSEDIDGEEDADEDSDSESDESSDGSDGDVEDADPTAETMDDFNENMNSIVDPSSFENFYTLLPKLNPKNFVYSIKKVGEIMDAQMFWRGDYAVAGGKTFLNKSEKEQELFIEFRNKNNKAIQSMVQEFELRRNAAQFARAKVSKTGRLDTGRLWSYKISENLFKQTTIVPEGKNHGMLLFLDMSGSMDYNMFGTIEQLTILASFCRKVQIPFDVYGFNNARQHTDFVEIEGENYEQRIARAALKNDQTPGSFQVDPYNFKLWHLMSSESSSATFNLSVKKMLMMAQAFDRKFREEWNVENRINLGSTPLVDTILLARSIADAFRKNHKVEILNTVFLTDGDGDRTGLEIKGVNHASYESQTKHLVIEDPITKLTMRTPCNRYTSSQLRLQKILLEMYSKVTGSRLTNFFLVDGKFKRQCKDAFGYGLGAFDAITGFEPAWKSYQKEKVFFLENNGGYNSRFLVPGGRNLQTKEDTIQTTAYDKKSLTKAFGAYQAEKRSNRFLMTRMAKAFA